MASISVISSYTRRCIAGVRSAVVGMLPGQSVDRRLRDAARYWAEPDSGDWSANSHWQGGLGSEEWLAVGRDHLAMFDVFAKALDLPTRPDVIVEWGCGGGANAVAFAPRCQQFVAADISQDSIDECLRQVGTMCDTICAGVLIDIHRPETAAVDLHSLADLFLCFYVMELTANREEALRILTVAEQILKSGGMAMIQIKYHTTDPGTRGRRRNYRRNLASMTTFAIDEFWLCCADIGLTPQLVTLVPRNNLDVRYAYFALTKP